MCRLSSMIRLLALLGTLGTVLPAAAQQPAAPNRLQPSGKWVVDYGETECVALRNYPEAGGMTTLAIRPAPNGTSYDVVIVKPSRFRGSYSEQFEGSVDFGRGPVQTYLLRSANKTNTGTIYEFRLPAATMMQARSASSATFRGHGGLNASFALTNMARVMSGLEACTRNLQQHWNHGPAGAVGIVTPPKEQSDFRGLFKPSDYPLAAMDGKQEGTSQLVMLVNEQGRVAGCFVAQPSGVPVIDGMGCQVLRERARFAPARDAAGKPVRSMYFTPPIRWRLYN